MHSISDRQWREIGAAADGDLESGAAKQIDGRVFETAFGNAEFEFHLVSVHGVRIVRRASLIFHSPLRAAEEAALVTFVTDAGPSASHFRSTASRSQSVEISLTTSCGRTSRP
jgi:hypothetical protein